MAPAGGVFWLHRPEQSAVKHPVETILPEGKLREGFFTACHSCFRAADDELNAYNLLDFIGFVCGLK